MTTIIELEPSKGVGRMTFEPVPGGYFVVEHRRNKETGVVNHIFHEVTDHQLGVLHAIIRDNCKEGIEYGYAFIVRKLITAHKLSLLENVSEEFLLTAFNGGRFRAAYYFPLYYYPLKILENQGYIDYFGKGGLRLRGAL